MRLEKREITLNEADSLKDVFYLEKALASAYSGWESYTERKELKNELPALIAEVKQDAERVHSLWEEAKAGKFC